MAANEMSMSFDNDREHFQRIPLKPPHETICIDNIDATSETDMLDIEESSIPRTPNQLTDKVNEFPSPRNSSDATHNDDDGNLALFQTDLSTRPRVAVLLNRVIRGPGIDDHSSLHDETALQKSSEVVKLGILLGVYLPTMQNILGVILFLRLTWIVGEAGALEAFFIVLLCCTTTMLTAISMSAIATNGHVPAGGSYYMISRSLGPEFGGAVGLLFYLGTTFASGMYVVGAIEILLVYIAPGMSAFGPISVDPNSNPEHARALAHNMRLYGSVLLLMLSAIVFVGVKYVNKTAMVFLAAVILAVLSIYIGVFASPTGNQPNICISNSDLRFPNDTISCAGLSGKEVKAFPGLRSDVFLDNWKPHYSSETSFTILLAIFFPSVTGIMAGSNRSGDLRDPSTSIPRGTIGAIATTSTLYLTCVLFFAATVHGELLRDKFGLSINGSLVVAELSYPTKWIILVGALLSTVGAGLQSLMGAPRLLQAIAQDGIIPILSPFRVGHGAQNEPRRALYITTVISWLGVLIAQLDAIAPIVTMFFLMCYAFVNFATAIQSLLQSPSWRPRFKYYHWGASLIGAGLCIALMFISHWGYALGAFFIAGITYKYIEFKGAAKDWGDGLRGLSMQHARYSLLKLEEGQQHTKNWRPQVLCFCDLNSNYELRYPHLLSLIYQLKKGHGLSLLVSTVNGEYTKVAGEVERTKTALKEAVKEHKVKGFVEVIASNDKSQAMSFLVQGSGLGGLRHNTVVMAWPSDWRETDLGKCFIDTVRVSSRHDNAILVPKGLDLFPADDEVRQGFMDVWWVVHDGGMLMLLPFLLRQHRAWRKCKLRIFTVAEKDDNSIQMKKDLDAFLYQLRINAIVEVVEMESHDISAYTYERTLQMEERTRLLKDMKLTKGERKKEVSSIPDTAHSRSRTMNESMRVSEHSLNEDNPSDADSVKSMNQNDNRRKPDDENVRRMNTCLKLNKIIKENSLDSQLVLVNLPGAISDDFTSAGENYMEFLEALTESLPRVLYVRGSGKEVVTIYS